MRIKILLMLLLSMNFVNAQEKTIQISGVISSNSTDKISIQDISGEEVVSFLVKNDKIKGDFKASKGYYKLHIGEEYTNVYLIPGGDLSFTIDLKEFDETISYTGSLAEENNILAKKMLLLETIDNADTKLYMTQPEDSFVNSMTDFFNSYETLYKSSSLDEDFRKNEKRKNQFAKWNYMTMYPSYHKYYTKKKEFEVSDAYYNFLVQLNVNDKTGLKYDEFIYLVDEYFSFLTKKKAKVQNISENQILLAKYELMNVRLTDSEIRNAYAKQFYKRELNTTEDIEQIKNLMQEFIRDDELIVEMVEYAERIQQLSPGSQAPDFDLLSSNGDMKSLKDYRGKILYIDVWATWCGPCKKELPHYQKLKSLYKGKNIEFVSVCVWDQMEAWTKFLEAEKLDGEQLFIKGRHNEFVDSYLIEGVPTFILIDEKGNLISRSAERPSDDALRDRFDKLLN